MFARCWHACFCFYHNITIQSPPCVWGPLQNQEHFFRGQNPTKSQKNPDFQPRGQNFTKSQKNPEPQTFGDAAPSFPPHPLARWPHPRIITRVGGHRRQPVLNIDIQYIHRDCIKLPTLKKAVKTQKTLVNSNPWLRAQQLSQPQISRVQTSKATNDIPWYGHWFIGILI